MDNQTKDQKSIKENSTISNQIIPENPISETSPASTTQESQIPITVENPISTMTEVPTSETELPSTQPQPETEAETEIEETAPPSEYQNEYQDILNQYAANQETIAPTPGNETPSSTPTITDSDIFPIPPQNNLFKIIFIISLIIFVLTSTVLAFIYFKSQNNQKSSISNTIIETAPTPTISDTCFLNDKTYQTGETFTATDGCNNCTCVSQNNISCTDKECPSSKSATESATNSTKTATTSAVPKDWKTYTNSDYNFSFQYPSGYEIKNDIKTATEVDISVRKINDSQEAENSDSVCSNCTFRIQILKNFIGGTSNGIFKNPEEWMISQNKLDMNLSRITLNDNIAYFASNSKTGREDYFIYVQNNDLYTRFNLNIKIKNDISKTILSTFKFN